MFKKLFLSKYLNKLRSYLEVQKKNQSTHEFSLKKNNPNNLELKYQLGYADPIKKASFGPTDIKIFFGDKKGNYYYIPEVQSIDWNYSLYNNKTIKFESLVLDSDLISNLSFVVNSIILEARNEYGTIVYSKFDNVQFANSSCKHSIDNMFLSVENSFSFETMISWKHYLHSEKPKSIEPVPDHVANRFKEYK